MLQRALRSRSFLLRGQERCKERRVVPCLTLEISPEHEPALFGKIVTFVKQGKEAEAEACFREGWAGREGLSCKGALLAPLLADPPMEPG